MGLFLFLIGSLKAQDYWEYFPGDFDTISKLITWNDTVLAYNETSVYLNDARITKSTDGITWSRLNLPGVNLNDFYTKEVSFFSIESGLFIFTNKITPTNGLIKIFKTEDGSNYELYYESNLKAYFYTHTPVGNSLYSFAYNDNEWHVYRLNLETENPTLEDTYLLNLPLNNGLRSYRFLETNGTLFLLFVTTTELLIYKKNINDPASSWIEVNPPPIISSTFISYAARFFLFKGAIHFSIIDMNSNNHMYKLDDFQDQWIEVYTNSDFYFNQLKNFGGNLFAITNTYVGMWTDGTGEQYQWNEIDLRSTPISFGVLLDRLFLATQRGLYKLSDQKTWELSLGGYYYLHQSFSLRNAAFILEEVNQYRFQRGVVEIENIPPTARSIPSGEKNTHVLGFHTKVNDWEEMFLEVKNLGTAVQGRDIEHLQLVRVHHFGEENQYYESIQTMEPVLDNSRHWKTPNSFHVYPDAIYFVVADISENPIDGVTCIFMADENSMTFQENKTFIPVRPLTTNSEQVIKKMGPLSAPDDYSKVTLFPQPSRDTVHFRYDLESPSDVAIKLFDRNGVLVTEIMDPNKPQGSSISTPWDARQTAPGIYYAIINIKPTSGSERVIKKKVFVDR